MEHTKLFLIKNEIYHITENWIASNEEYFLKKISNLNSSCNLETQSNSRDLKAFFELIFLTCFNGTYEKNMWKWENTIIKGFNELDRLGLLNSPFMIPPYKYLIETYCKKYHYKDTVKDRVNFDNRELTHTLKSEIVMYKSMLNSPNLNDLKQVYKNSLLGRKVPLINLNNNQLYTITHIIFYVSLLNNLEISQVLDSKEIEYSLDLLKTLIVFSDKINHFDLLGELLICLVILKENDLNDDEKSLLIFNLELLLEKFVIPTTKFDQTEENFNKYYHQILVMNILGRVLI